MSTKRFKITHSRFLKFWFNTGDDGSQHDMRTNIGYDAVKSLEETGKFNLTIEDLWANCEWVRASYIYDYDKLEGEILKEYEDGEIWVDEIELVDDRELDGTKFQECGCCEKKLFEGDHVGYDNNYNVYCNNGECNTDVMEYTTLEECWWV